MARRRSPRTSNRGTNPTKRQVTGGARLANPDTERPTECSVDDEAGRDLAMDDRTPGVAHGRVAEAVDTWLHGLTERCWERMVQTAMWANHGRDGAEGIAQRALVVALSKALQDPDLIATVDHPGAWLIAITRNVARDIRGTELRRARIRRENAEYIREVLFPQPDPEWDVDRLCKRVLDLAARALKETSHEARKLEVVAHGYRRCFARRRIHVDTEHNSGRGAVAALVRRRGLRGAMRR